MAEEPEKRNGEAEARDLALVPTRADGEALKRVSQRSHVVSFEGAVELVDEGLLVRQDVVVEALGITGGRRRGRVVQFNVPDGIRVADIELVLEDDKIEVSFAGRVEKRSAKDAGLTRLGRGGGKTIAFAALVEVACFGNVSIARLGASNAIGYDARVRTLRESLVALFGSDLGEFLENKGGVATPTIKVVQGRSLRVRLPGSAAWSDLSFQLLDKDKCRVAMVNSDSLYGTWSVTLWLQALDASGKTTNSRTLRQLLSNGRAMPGADHVDDALRLSHALSAHFAAEALGPAIDVGRTNVQCEFTILRAVS